MKFLTNKFENERTELYISDFRSISVTKEAEPSPDKVLDCALSVRDFLAFGCKGEGNGSPPVACAEGKPGSVLQERGFAWKTTLYIARAQRCQMATAAGSPAANSQALWPHGLQRGGRELPHRVRPRGAGHDLQLHELGLRLEQLRQRGAGRRQDHARGHGGGICAVQLAVSRLLTPPSPSRTSTAPTADGYDVQIAKKMRMRITWRCIAVKRSFSGLIDASTTARSTSSAPA